MFFVLAKQDIILVTAFVVSIFTLFIIVFVIVTKTLPTKHSFIDLDGKGFFIAIGIHLVIILFCFAVTIQRVIRIDHFIHNGISTKAFVQKIDKASKKLKIFYQYEIKEKVYFGTFAVYVKNEFDNFAIGTKLLIFVDPKSFDKSLFIGLAEVQENHL